MVDYADHLKTTLQQGRRRQEPLNPRKYRYVQRFDDLPAGFNHIVGIVLFGFDVDARSHLLELLEPQFGLLTVGPVGIELDGLLIRLDGARRKHDFVSVAHALGGHHIDERSAEKIPTLRVFRIELGRDSLLHRLRRCGGDKLIGEFLFAGFAGERDHRQRGGK